MVKYQDHMKPERWYQGLDPGIRFAVRVLHAAGVETCQSCQGGKGHAYDRATVDLQATGHDAWGFRAVSVLHDYGLPVQDIALLWNVKNGLPYDQLWRVTFTRSMPERADEKPMFVQAYRTAK